MPLSPKCWTPGGLMAMFYYPLPRTHSGVLPWGREQVELRGRWIIGSRCEIRGQRCWQLRWGGEDASGANADCSHLSIFIRTLSCLCQWALAPSVPKAYFKRLHSNDWYQQHSSSAKWLNEKRSIAAFIIGKVEILPHCKRVDFGGNEQENHQKEAPGRRFFATYNTFYTPFTSHPPLLPNMT